MTQHKHMPCMQTPMCMISLVVENRQWFMSQKGMGCSGSDRDASFCAWMLLPKYPEMLVVEDATLDSRWADAWYAGLGRWGTCRAYEPGLPAGWACTCMMWGGKPPSMAWLCALPQLLLQYA